LSEAKAAAFRQRPDPSSEGGRSLAPKKKELKRFGAGRGRLDDRGDRSTIKVKEE